MAGKVHCIGDDGSRCICRPCVVRQNGDGIGNAQRKTATAPSTGREAANIILGADFQCGEQARPRLVDNPNRERLTGRQMQRDISSIVHVAAHEFRAFRHGFEDLFGHRSRDRGHWRNETPLGIRRDRLRHPLSDCALWPWSILVCGLPKQRKLRTPVIQYFWETMTSGFISGANLFTPAVGLHDQVDWSIVKVKPASVRQKTRNGQLPHFPPPSDEPGRSGHGFCAWASCRWCSFSFNTSASGRTESMWPPSAP